jgi:tetratricopeptide (TPR) repeat protein
MPAPSCSHHPDVPATTRCGSCLHPLCAACTVFEGGLDRCPSCVAAHWRARKRQKGLLIAAGVAVLAAGGAYVYRSGVLPSGDASAGSPESEFNYGLKAPHIKKLRQQLAKEPCDRTKGVEYVQALFAAEDWRGTLQSAEDFIARCGKFPQLRSLTYSAHMRLSEFDQAIGDATELIESTPGNGGYWVWRAQAHESKQESDKALADFEQAFSLQPTAFQVANHLASAYERRKRPCDAYFVLLEHVKQNPHVAGQPDFEARLLQLVDQGKCMGKRPTRQ